MLTSFFGKSAPINYVLVGAFIFIGYFFGALSGSEFIINYSLAFENTIFIGLFIFSMLLLDFVIRKNSLTRQNTFAIVFFASFMVMLPVVFFARDIFLANFFILLAMRRIMSLRSGTNTEKKILDASIYITVASFFAFYSFILVVALVLALLRTPNASYKHLLIPIIGFFAIFSINTSIQFLFNGDFSWFYNWHQSASFDFSAYHSPVIFIPVAVLGAFLIWTVTHRLQHLSQVPLKDRPNYRLLIIIVACAAFIIILSPEKTGAELLFIFAPLSIMITNYMETLSTSESVSQKFEFWFKESLLWLVLVLAVVMLVI